MTHEEWLEYGWIKGWCGPPVCLTHDGEPISEEEDDDMFDGCDVCIHVIRVYPDADTAQEIAKSHPPSVWRATNRGWPTKLD